MTSTPRANQWRGVAMATPSASFTFYQSYTSRLAPPLPVFIYIYLPTTILPVIEQIYSLDVFTKQNISSLIQIHRSQACTRDYNLPDQNSVETDLRIYLKNIQDIIDLYYFNKYIDDKSCTIVLNYLFIFFF